VQSRCSIWISAWGSRITTPTVLHETLKGFGGNSPDSREDETYLLGSTRIIYDSIAEKISDRLPRHGRGLKYCKGVKPKKAAIYLSRTLENRTCFLILVMAYEDRGILGIIEASKPFAQAAPFEKCRNVAAATRMSRSECRSEALYLRNDFGRLNAKL
jgi:hypothetical protein